MKKHLLVTFTALILSLNFIKAQAQITFTEVADSPTVTLYATPALGGVSSLTSLISDDEYSGVFNIGFTFNFYGTPYTQCVIGENGMLTFDLAMAGGYDAWPISAPLLGNISAENSICGPWCDIYGLGPDAGEITYLTTGTAPNRMFAATYCHVSMYFCTSQVITTQIILYETSNIIEVHITHKDTCVTWNGGYAIVGVSNASGTAATTAPGRDYPAVWATDNEAWRFTPAAGDSSYTVDSIPYAPIPYYTVYWYDSTTGAYVGEGDSIMLTPLVPTAYLAVATTCNDTSTIATAGGTSVDTGATGYVDITPPHHTPVTGVSTLPSIQKLSIFPNPAHNQLNISADDIIDNVVITDLLGQAVLQQANAAKNAQVNIAGLAPGIYLVRINGTIMQKFVKE